MAKQTKSPGQASPGKQSDAASGYDWSKVGATGFENVQREDLGIPFFSIVESKSPEFDKTNKEYQAKKIVGCGPGDVFNNLSREILHKYEGTPMIVVPCSFERAYVEWKPRNSGGGLVRVHKNPRILNEAERNEKNQDILKNGNLLVTTAYFYCLLLSGQDRIPMILGMKSTQLKKARFWLNLQQGIKFTNPRGEKYTPPMFSHSYELSTGPEVNEEGSWFGWKIATHEQLKDPLLIADAIETSKKAITGQRIALPSPTGKTEDDVPFA